MTIAPAAYLHRIDPFAVHFSGELGIRWYGISYAMGFLAAYFFIWWMARRDRSLLTPRQVGDFVMAGVVGTMLGGRLGYCVLYQPDLLIDFSSSFPFWGVLALWKGGMASHGGILGIILACLWYGRRHGISVLHLLDLTVIGGTIGIFFGRVANFINGELYGRAASGIAWAVKFPQEIDRWANPAHPLHDQLSDPRFIEAAERAQLLAARGSIRSVADPYQQIIIASRSDAQVAELLRPLLVARHPSQLYEALLEGLLLLVVLGAIWYRPRRPGVISGWFLVLYAVVRIIGEQFRLPDAHIGFQWLGLTRGQWLSILMLTIGLGCLWYWARRPVEHLSGWGARTSHRRRRRDSQPVDPGST